MSDPHTEAFKPPLYIQWSSDPAWFNTMSTGGEVTITGLSNIWKKTIGRTRNYIVIPQTIYDEPVTGIGDYAFSDKQGLVSIDIPASIAHIGNYAFGRCSSLAVLTCFSTTPPSLGTGIFTCNFSKLKIMVPPQSLSAYKIVWADFASLIFPH